MDNPQELNSEDVAALAELFDLLARFEAEDSPDGHGEAKPVNHPLEAN